MGPVVSPPTTTGVRFEVPLCATAAWILAVTRAGGVCQCTGACGRKHTTGGGTCERVQGARGVMLHLTGDGAVYCPRCHDSIAQAAASTAPVPVADQLDITALLA